MKNYKNIYMPVKFADEIDRRINTSGEECESLTEAKRKARELGGYADEDGGGEFARVCDDERKAEAFFKRETENGNGVYYTRIWSAETPRRVVAVGD